jgi:hypothetical protein
VHAIQAFEAEGDAIVVGMRVDHINAVEDEVVHAMVLGA